VIVGEDNVYEMMSFRNGEGGFYASYIEIASRWVVVVVEAWVVDKSFEYLLTYYVCI
jgi:hypothetical protein